MKKNNVRLTTAQFAKLHEVNRRTLHYYDTINLFSPNNIGNNGYRYYDLSQSIDFEYIRMLKKLNMSIEEIKDYLKNPNPQQFIKIANTKDQEIDAQIEALEKTKKILQMKKKQINFCNTLAKQEIVVTECKAERLLVLPYDYSDDSFVDALSFLKRYWDIEQICMGIGSYISIENVLKNNFEEYEGIYTPVLTDSYNSKSIIKPKGKYLCGYHLGKWDKLPLLYKKMVAYAKENQLKLTGYAYEIGLNEFTIKNEDEYITQIMIKIAE